MKHIARILGRDWEKALLGGVLIVSIAFGVTWLHTSETPSSRDTGSFGHARQTFLAPSALAFMGNSDRTNQEDDLVGLFGFAYRDETPPSNVKEKQDKQVITDTDGGDVIPKDPKDQDVVVTDTDTGGGGLPPERPAKPEVRTIRYLGIYIGTTGKRLAAVEILDPATGKKHTGFWDTGKIPGGVQVQAFDGNRIRFLAPDGRDGTVARGANVTIQLQ